MKFRRLFKKAAATLMAAVTALSVLPATTAFAAGDIGTISFAHTYDSSGNAMRYNSSAVFDGYTAGGTGEYKYRMFVDGENAFCIQPGVPLKTGNTLKKASSDTWNALSANQKKAVGLALLYGYQGNRSHLSGSDDEKWLATQTLVWEFVTGCREATGSYKQNSTKAYSLHFGSNYPNSGAKAAYDQIVSLMAKHNTIPSFMSGEKNDITKELAYKDGKYSITLTDKNGVLSDYSFSSSDGNVKVSRSGDKLTISSAAAVSGSVRITAKRNGVPTVSDSAKMIAYGDPNLQDLVTGVENADTVAAYLNIETPTGTIALKKTSEDGVVGGIQFNIKVATDLPFGSYYVREISTNSAYIISDQKYPVTFEYAGQDTTTVHITANEGEAIENKLIYGSVSGKKSDEDGKVLGGAVIGIFKSGTEEFTKENAIQTTTSKDDGSFSFAKVPYGTWIIREIESPKGFVLSEEEIAVTIGKVDEVVEIELVNYFIQGNIELTKVDKDYPDNKLSGAVFEVFADTNKNGEFNKDDELIGEMSEIDGGIYQMKELRYGKYFVREKTAPTGFVLDEKVYTVSIEEDGKTYVVENEAGKGFVNAAQTGSLKIVKTSSDGKLEGFSFRVTGMDYDKTFKTDKNGEIFIEDLRIGEYTVSEVNDKASAGYILPADKQATIKVDATTIVQMHNEFRDTPKTGDDFNPALWVNLAVVSLAGAGVLGFVGFKNRKKKED